MNVHNFFIPSQYPPADLVYSTNDVSTSHALNTPRNSLSTLWLGTSSSGIQQLIKNDSNPYTQDNLSIEETIHPKRKPLKRMYENNPAEVITPEQHQLSIKDSPSYFLGLLIDSDVITWLINETNLHGKNMKHFTPVTEDEMRCFIAILYLSGYIDVPRRRMLWERSPDTHCLLVSTAMQRDRFESIFTAIHADTSKDDATNLNHIHAFINLLNQKFLCHIPADDQHSIAQCTVSSFSKHHNAKNSSKNLKVWCACTKIGYCTWSNPIPSALHLNESNLNPQSVILHYANIARQFQTGLAILLFENCYLDTSLLYELRKLGVQGSSADREKSGCVLNPPLGGVDKLDCNLNLYRTSMHGKKAYSAILTFCLDLALNNAWHLYKLNTKDKKPLDLLGFRRNIVVYYLQHYAKPILNRKGGRPSKIKSHGKRPPPSDARFDGIRHYVIPQEKQTRCAKCSMKTTTRCQKCNIGVHVKCFVEFHTRPKQLSIGEIDISPKNEIT